MSWQRYCTVSSSGCQPNFAALNRGRHLCTVGRPSCWALAHILVNSEVYISKYDISWYELYYAVLWLCLEWLMMERCCYLPRSQSIWLMSNLCKTRMQTKMVHFTDCTATFVLSTGKFYREFELVFLKTAVGKPFQIASDLNTADEQLSTIQCLFDLVLLHL